MRKAIRPVLTRLGCFRPQRELPGRGRIHLTETPLDEAHTRTSSSEPSGRSPWDERTACSPARTCWRHNAAVHGRQADWARISYRGHPDLGQVVRVVRRMTRDGAVMLVVKLPDGRSGRVPLSWTETAPHGPTMPALLFSPGSPRALV